MFCIYANKLVEKICIYTFNQAIKAQKNTFKRKNIIPIISEHSLPASPKVSTKTCPFFY
jgi:hypothetical protein